jgi:hypothetical protein
MGTSFFEEHGREGLQTWFLLADCSQRCGPDSEILPGMPILCHTNPHPSRRAPNDPHHLALHHMGLDLLGPFKKAPGGWTHLLVMIDKFTKWVEPKTPAKIGSKQVVDFIQDIIFRFGCLTQSLPTTALSSPKRSS